MNGEKVNMSALEIPESGSLNMGNKLCGVLITGMCFMCDV